MRTKVIIDNYCSTLRVDERGESGASDFNIHCLSVAS
jgi:hypothetical protein